MTDILPRDAALPTPPATTGSDELVPERQRRRRPIAAITILALVVAAAIVGGGITGNDPLVGDLANGLQPPVWGDGGTWAHPLGTDQLGRDMLTRLLGGARVTLIVALCGVVFAAILGSTIGIVAGYVGRWVDSVLMRITDVVLAVPMLVLGLALAVSLGPGMMNVVIVLTVLMWATYARLVRGEVLRLREMDYIVSARLSGVQTFGILRRHILPNVLNTIVVLVSLQVGQTIIIAASLSFLGMGVPEPEPEWGLMLANAQDYLRLAWWLAVFPGVALALTVLAANILGDWVRDRLDPSLVNR